VNNAQTSEDKHLLEGETAMPNTHLIKKILIVSILLTACCHTHAAIIYVDASAVGSADGTNWSDACTDMQSALAVASFGDEIWVAQGIYEPTPGIDPTQSFILPSGVSIYGGFSAGETSLDQRDFSLYETVLSGDIGIDANLSDNLYHVVVIQSVTNVRLDGFTITQGYARGTGDNKHGGGVFCKDADETNLMINCLITDNHTADGPASSTYEGSAGGQGGGIYLHSSSLSIENCQITLNTTGDGGTYGSVMGSPGGSGGGVYGEDSSASFVSCSVSQNITGKGGPGQLAENGGHGAGFCFVGLSTPSLSDCVITENQTGMGGDDGGGYYATDVRGDGGSGAGVFCGGEATSIITGCQITNNTTGSGPGGGGGDGHGGKGAGICILTSSTTQSVFISDTLISGNNTGGGGGDSGFHSGMGGMGGGLYAEGAVELFNCTIENNLTGNSGEGYNGNISGQGGGIALVSSNAVVTNCTISSNRTGDGGSGDYPEPAAPGGGVYCSNSTALFSGCLVSSNTLGESGDGTFSTNGANGSSGAGFYIASSSTTIRDCTITLNQTSDGKTGGPFSGGNGGSGAGIYQISSTSSISGCLIQSNTTGMGGAGFSANSARGGMERGFTAMGVPGRLSTPKLSRTSADAGATAVAAAAEVEMVAGFTSTLLLWTLSGVS
jgi:hypothetical protein